MSRVRADDYGDKRQGILDTAAVLFAETGYANAKMMDIARRCGASKSMLYHYFPKKEDVLFHIVKEQAESYLEATEAVVSRASPPDQRLREFVTMWVRKSTEARARLAVLMYELKFLPKRQQKIITDLERRLIDQLASLVAQVNPSVKQAGASHEKTYALLLFGMLSWTELWYRSTGPLGPDEMADRISSLFLHGLSSATAARGSRSLGV